MPVKELKLDSRINIPSRDFELWRDECIKVINFTMKATSHADPVSKLILRDVASSLSKAWVKISDVWDEKSDTISVPMELLVNGTRAVYWANISLGFVSDVRVPIPVSSIEAVKVSHNLHNAWVNLMANVNKEIS